MPHDVPTLSPGPSEQQLVAPPSAAELRGAFSSLLDLIPTCVAIVDVHGLMVRLANPAFRAAASDPEIDPVGRTVEEIWPTEAGLELRALLEAAANGEPSRCEWLPGCGDDEWQRSFTAHAQCVAAGAGRVLLLILWETTEMQGARRQAERSRERAELIASVAADLNGGVDIGAVLGTAVRRAAELLGVEDASVWLLDAGGEDLRRTAERQAHGGREALPLRHLPSAQAVLRDHEARLVRREQAAPLERAWMAVRRLSAALVVPLVDQSGPMGILYLEYQGKRFLPGPADVTFAEAIAGQCALALGRARVFEGERAARGRAEEAEREARWAERLQERLAAVVGRDLQTSLQAVTAGMSALGQSPRVTDADRAILTRMASSTGQMERVIADLLDFARARAGIAVPVERAPVRLDEVARAAGDQLAAATGSSVALEVEGDCGLSGDAVRLAQLVGNLYRHAHRHGAGGTPVRARLVGGPEEVMLEVEAHGLGAGPIALGQLFEPFHETERDPLREDLGLGLFLVREIARAHGGAVRVVPAGAVMLFQVVLPRRVGG